VALWLACGGLIALAAQERSNILVFIAVFPALSAWQWRKSRRRSALLPLCGLAGAALVCVPWGFVNKKQSGYFNAVPSYGGVNLYLGNKPGTDGIVVAVDRPVNYNDRVEDPVEVWAREGYEIAMRARGLDPEKNPGAISVYWTRQTWDEIKGDPAGWLRLMARKCWLTLWNAEIPNNKSFAFLQAEYAWLRFLPVRWVVLLMLAPAGIWVAARFGNREALFIVLLYAALYSAANVLFFVCDRYRYPTWPAMAIVAGGGLMALAGMIRWRRWNQALVVTAAMAVIALVSVPDWPGAKLPSFARDYRVRSVAWYDKGNFVEALNDIDHSIALDPSDTAALHHRGNVLLALNRYGEARLDFEKTLKISPDDAGLWNNYGIALDGLGKTNDALVAFRHATECHPPSKSAFLGLAFDETRLGRLQDASSTLDELDNQQRIADPMVLALRAVLAAKLGDAAQAASLEQQARNLDSDAADWAMKHASSGE
jgi:Tfp pilus assembly protein PilF